MIDFQISQSEIATVADLLTKARKNAKAELVDVTVLRSTARFVVTGREYECDVEAETPGFAQVPLELLPQLQKTAKSFPDDPIRIRIEAGRIRIKSAAVNHPGIALTKGRVRSIDVPDDAPAIDFLAIKQIFSAAQIKENSLTAKIEAAKEELDEALASAAASLAGFNVTKKDLSTLAATYVAAHEEKMRKVLLPK